MAISNNRMVPSSSSAEVGAQTLEPSGEAEQRQQHDLLEPSEAGESSPSSQQEAPVAAATTTTTMAASINLGQQLENVKVAVRLRPFTERERQRNSRRIVDIEQNTVVLYSPKYGETSMKKFTFDYSYWSHDGFRRNPDGINEPDPGHPNAKKYVGQERVFEDLGAFLLENALQGYNSALLAYGQTGSGKSYTVSGYGKNEGILPRFARSLFAELDRRIAEGPEESLISPSSIGKQIGANSSDQQTEEGHLQSAPRTKNRYEVYFSMIEIYNEVVRDLLAKGHPGHGALGQTSQAASLARRGLKVREHPKRGFFVEGLSSYLCSNKDEIELRIEEGQLNKSIAATSMNETSSRGHTIYEFRLKQFKLRDPMGAVQPPMGGGESLGDSETLTTSVVQLVDLAGSERLAIHVTGQLGGDSFIGSRASSPYPGEQSATAGSSFAATNSHGPANSSQGAPSRRLRANTQRMAKANQTQPNSASSTASSLQQTPVGPANQTSLRRPAAGQHQASSSLYASDSNNHHHQRFKESVSINQSLSALGNCIQVLSQYSQQQPQDANPVGARPNVTLGSKQALKIPYRDSVLTKLLNRCCLSGNSKVVIIATLSPADANYDDTLSTLRFADRAKQIRTHATINRMSRREIVNVLQKENERLKQLIDGRVTRSDDSSQTSNFDDTENMIDNFNGPKVASSMATNDAGAEVSGQGQHRTITKRLPGARSNANASGSGSSKVPQTDVGAGLAGINKSNKGSRTFSKGAQEADRRAGASIGRPARKIGLSGGSVSNPALNEQLQGLVSPASRKILLTSTAGKATSVRPDEKSIKKSRSMGTGLAQMRKQDTKTLELGEINYPSGGEPSLNEKNLLALDELDLVEASSLLLDEIDLADLIDIEQDEGLLSPDSDDSFAALAEEGLTQEEKIRILNRLLSNSNVANKIRKQYEKRRQASGAATNRSRPLEMSGRIPRPTRLIASDDTNANLNKMSAISSSLKKTNPYLSNLNPDEQLTGMITYIIKLGETIVGKNNDCDILLYGPELRGRHAKITRLEQMTNTDSKSQEADAKLSQVFIEPILDKHSTGTDLMKHDLERPNGAKGKRSELYDREMEEDNNVALMVNGMPLCEKIQLHHCDRLLFGSNAYFVYIDQIEASQGLSGLTVANQNLVTYDMAHNEVLRKVMSEAKNEAVIREIKDYTHRPGTGRHKDTSTKLTSSKINIDPKKSDNGERQTKDKVDIETKLSTSRLTRSLTIHGEQEQENSTTSNRRDNATSKELSFDTSDKSNNRRPEGPLNTSDTNELNDTVNDNDMATNVDQASIANNSSNEINYRDKLMEDTYEYAMPVAEVNAIAKEMRIKVNYGLKILTGEEQLPEMYNYLDGSDSLSSISGSTGGTSNGLSSQFQSKQQQQQLGDQQPMTVQTIYEDATKNLPVITNIIKPDSLDVPPALYIHVHLEEQDMNFYWSKEKFQARRFRILELYGAWDVGGKSGLVEYLIEQSKYQGDYLIDPFIDDPQSTQVLIGHAQVTLKPLSHRADVADSFDILDLNDEIVGSIDVQAIPCHSGPSDDSFANLQKQQQAIDLASSDGYSSAPVPPFWPLNDKELEANLVENPRELLGKRLIFLIRILSCRNVPKRYCHVYCQYTLNRDKSFVRTNLARCGDTEDEQLSNLELDDERENNGASTNDLINMSNETSRLNKVGGNTETNGDLLKFNHLHYITIERVDQDILDFLEHGFLAIQVVGRYGNINIKNERSLELNSGATIAASSGDISTSTKNSSSPTLITTIINSINKYKYKIEQQGGALNGMNYSNGVYTNSLTDSANSNRMTSSGIVNSNSGASSVASTMATVNLFDQQNDDDEGANSINGLSQENIIDMILTKRKLDRAENQLHYLKRTINIAEHYNKKHIPVKTVKKLLNSYGHEIESGSLEEMVADVNVKGKSTSNKNSGCTIQ